MVRFQKLTRNLFLTGTKYTVSSGNCPSFSCATSSSLLMLTAGPLSKMASQQEKAFCSLRFEVFRSVITVQREFRVRFILWLMHAILETGPAVSMRSELLNFWNCAILLCIPCTLHTFRVTNLRHFYRKGRRRSTDWNPSTSHWSWHILVLFLAILSDIISQWKSYIILSFYRHTRQAFNQIPFLK